MFFCMVCISTSNMVRHDIMTPVDRCTVNERLFVVLRGHHTNVTDSGFDLPHRTWSLLNCFQTDQGWCLANLHNWGLVKPAVWECGQQQTMMPLSGWKLSDYNYSWVLKWSLLFIKKIAFEITSFSVMSLSQAVLHHSAGSKWTVRTMYLACSTAGNAVTSPVFLLC